MRARRLLPSVLALLACVVGCDLPNSLGDLGGSLLDPDAELLDAPGRQLAQGHYSRLELDGSLESGGWVIAKRHDVESVSVISFVGDGQCELEGATDFQRVSSRIDVALPGLIAFQRGQGADSAETVEFAGFDCGSKLEPVVDSSLPTLAFPNPSPRGLLMLTRAGRLLLVNAAGETLEEVATGVKSGSVDGDRIWLLRAEDDVQELVVYDADFNSLARWSGVSEMLVPRGWTEPSAVVRDAEGLHFVTVATGAKELIDADGCSPVALGSQVLGYFAPCSERHLRLSAPGQIVGRQEDRLTIDIAPDVIASAELMPYWQGKDSYLIYQVNSESGAATGELRVAERLGEEPDVRADADRSLLPNSWINRSYIYTDWDGTTGTLMVPQYTVRDAVSSIEALEPVASGVAQLPGGDIASVRGVLINYDGRVGDLVRFEGRAGEYTQTELAKGVPIQSQAVEPLTGAWAFVGDLDGPGGTAYLVTDGVPRAVGERALPNTLRFVEQPRALAYLADDGSGATNSLRVWLTDAQLNLRVSDQVSEYRELPWPSAGILYAIPQGDRAGIWFARAR